jgi:succinoglycan biosynthesis transport protein ExoP
MVPHKQFPEPSPGNDLVTYRQQMLGAPAMVSPSTPIGHHEALGPALWRRRWSIVALTLLSLLVGLAYLKHAKKLYPGIATITLSSNQSVVPSWGVPIAPTMQDPTWINTQIKIIASTPVLQAAAVKLGLDKQYSPDELQDLLDDWGTNLDVEPGAKDQTIQITFESPDPKAAAKVANAIVESYQDLNLQDSSDSTSRLLATLKSKEADLQKTRQDQLDALLKFQADNADFMSRLNQDGKGALLMNEDIKALRARIADARIAQIEAEANWDAANQAHDNPDKLRQMAGPQVVAQLDPVGQTLRSELGDVELRLDLLQRQGLGPNSPAVVQDKALEADLQDRITNADQKFADAYVGSLYQLKLKADEKVQEYQDELAKQMGGYQTANEIMQKFQKLNDALAETTSVLVSLDDSIKKLDVTGTSGGVDVHWIEHARIAMFPNLPAKYRTVGLALAVGLLLGIGSALLRDRLDQRIHTPEEVVGLLGVPVIGMIPHMRRTLTPVARGQAVHWDPMSEVAEAYRAVRTAVTFGVPAGAAKTIVVTSPTPGDGKSTLASNLAIALAQAGKRTLLLDSDFRRPVQHKLFEMSHEIGVTSVLAGRDALAKAIQKTACEGLDLLPSGPIPLNPSELLNGESFAEILDELAGVYDHIVLDCPPVMSVTDARILGAVCDVTILVVRANKVTRKNVEHVRAMLASVGARLLGCVVNDVPRGQGAEGYYGGYGYAPIEPVVRRREDVNMGGINGHRHLPAPVDAGNGR